MKKIVMTMLLLVATLTLVAQRGSGVQRNTNQENAQRLSPIERQEQELVRLTKELTLTAPQVAEIKILQERLSTDITKQRSAMTKDTDRQVMRTVMVELRQEYDTAIVKLLTAEQKVKYTAYKEKRDEQIKNSQGQDRGQRRGEGAGMGTGQGRGQGQRGARP